MNERNSASLSRPCPICGKPADPKHRPFCSPRCQTIDLGRWLKGDYRIPTNEGPEDGRRGDDDEDADA
jgi:endogenous inhibitor of DNA gyrase (YacG/DUF329 family)